MKIEEMNELTDEELYELAMQKRKNGCATSDALMAQRLIWARSGCGYCGKIGSVYVGEGNHTTKQYHYAETSRDLL